nr:uncharacterized protein LOC109169851 [Ipomoea trifida]
MADSTFSNREKNKQFDQEIREMISVLTGRLTTMQHAQKVGDSSQNKDRDEDDLHGTRIVTLAGNNMGASMRGEMDEKAGLEGDSEAMKTYVNSNFQAVNNSIMLGGSYSTNDPGVHMEVVDNVIEPQSQPGKRKKKGKKKEKDSSTSDHKNDHSD